MYVEETKSTLMGTEHVVRGKIEEVIDRIKALFGEYNAIVFATHCRGIFLCQHKDGPYEAVVRRNNAPTETQ